MRRLLLMLAAALGMLAAMVYAVEPADVLPMSLPPALSLQANGRHLCACTPMRDGCYTAKHCFIGMPAGTRLTVEGQPVPAYTLDANRDLAHIPLGADPSVEFGVPTAGDVAVWAGVRHGRAVYRGGVWLVGYTDARGRQKVQPQEFQKWAMATWGLDVPGLGVLQPGESPVLPGDSGGGFWVGGKLVGIISLAATAGSSCWTVSIP